MIGTVAMSSSAAAPAAQPLTLPLGAVVRAPGNPQQYAVVVIERQGEFEVARFRRVDLGDVVGNGVTVTGGVNAGERVITTGATLLTDGDRVRIIP
jgi:multidrug efflux system membrane fusion protein